MVRNVLQGRSNQVVQLDIVLRKMDMETSQPVVGGEKRRQNRVWQEHRSLLYRLQYGVLTCCGKRCPVKIDSIIL
jgi:hypothetical protein